MEQVARWLAEGRSWMIDRRDKRLQKGGFEEPLPFKLSAPRGIPSACCVAELPPCARWERPAVTGTNARALLGRSRRLDFP